MKILIADSFDSSLKEKLKKFGEVSEDKKDLATAQVVLIRSKTKATKEYIDSAPNLKLIIRGGVGTDNIDKAHAQSKGIKVMNTPKASSIAVAELAFAMMIAVPNHIVKAHQSMRDGQWLKSEIKRTELFGKTLCLIGTGNIGTDMAKRAKAFGMKVVGYDPVCKSHDIVEMKSSLEEAVKEAHYISMHVPFNDSTKDMINKNLISKMRDGVVIVNTARGKCIVTDDVIAALDSGKMACYATDVWPSDPPPADYPLLKHSGVLMAPHIGANSKENLLRIGDEVVEILSNFKV